MPVPGRHSVALLPTRTSINLHTPEKNEYYAGDLTYLVLADSISGKRQTVASTYGRGGNVGDSMIAHHDQQLYTFGVLKVIGIRYPDGRMVGEVPNRKLSLRVVK